MGDGPDFIHVGGSRDVIDGMDTYSGEQMRCTAEIYGRVCSLSVGHEGKHEFWDESGDGVLVMRWEEPRGA